MKPISEWTDAEIETIPASHYYAPKLGADLAAEVLRLRITETSLRATERILRAERLPGDSGTNSACPGCRRLAARAEKAEAELARCRPVVDAALVWFTSPFSAQDVVDDALEDAVDAYCEGDNQ